MLGERVEGVDVNVVVYVSVSVSVSRRAVCCYQFRQASFGPSHPQSFLLQPSSGRGSSSSMFRPGGRLVALWRSLCTQFIRLAWSLDVRPPSRLFSGRVFFFFFFFSKSSLAQAGQTSLLIFLEPVFFSWSRRHFSCIFSFLKIYMVPLSGSVPPVAAVILTRGQR